MERNLWNSYHIMNSDEDQLVVEDLDVGFDESMSLVVTIIHTDYEEPEYTCSVSAVVKKEDAFELSKKLKVSMIHLPDAISKSIEEYTEIVNADFQQVQACFKEIIDFFISKKVDGYGEYEILYIRRGQEQAYRLGRYFAAR